MGRCGLCATTLSSDGGHRAPRVPIGGIYNRVFIRRPQNFRRPLRRPLHAPKNKTRPKNRTAETKEVNFKRRLFCTALYPMLPNALSAKNAIKNKPPTYPKIINIYNEKPR